MPALHLSITFSTTSERVLPGQPEKVLTLNAHEKSSVRSNKLTCVAFPDGRR